MIYTIVDIETTGGYASSNGITEVAVFVHNGTKVIDHFETLINPRQPIPYFIQSMTGITDEMVARAPVFEEVADRLYALLHDKIFVAHNVNFDYSFLKHQLQQCGYELNTKKLCTVRLTRKVFTSLPSYSLGNICCSLQISVKNRHRAGGDAWATVQLFEILLRNNAQPFISQFLKKSSGEQYLPLHIQKEQIEQLPNKPGVYYFRNQKGKVIYVGKAKNLNRRVRSHFTHNGTGKQKQEFIRNIHDISYRLCGTELMAAILEETEIKKLWPVYNSSRKQAEVQYGLYLFEDQQGYTRLAIDRKKKHLRALHTFGLLLDGYALLWNIIKRYQLSPRLCFVDKTNEEDNLAAVYGEPAVYNKRVARALHSLQEELPSFAVLDEGVEEEQLSCLLIEKGKFYGMGFISKKAKLQDISRLKKMLTPYPDNDYIRNLIYRYAKDHPRQRVNFS
ncbi:MAG: exonuclease domain-containing protein [Chitinophagaceae bacterium]|nr:exonuclease domain-containing protein [Chitinophagaceae bacterium]